MFGVAAFADGNHVRSCPASALSDPDARIAAPWNEPIAKIFHAHRLIFFPPYL